MKKVHFSRPFTLVDSNGNKHRFGVGSQSVEDWVADHWFAKNFMSGEASEASEASVRVSSQALQALQAENESLKEENERLSAEVESLKNQAGGPADGDGGQSDGSKTVADFADMTVPQIKSYLAENADAVDTVEEAENAREDGPRDGVMSAIKKAKTG